MENHDPDKLLLWPGGGLGTIFRTILFFIIFMSLDSSGVTSTPYERYELSKELLGSVVYEQKENAPTNCYCKVSCTLDTECTAVTVISNDDGSIDCLYSNTQILTLSDTQENNDAVTFFKPVTESSKASTQSTTTTTGSTTTTPSTTTTTTGITTTTTPSVTTPTTSTTTTTPSTSTTTTSTTTTTPSTTTITPSTTTTTTSTTTTTPSTTTTTPSTTTTTPSTTTTTPSTTTTTTPSTTTTTPSTTTTTPSTTTTTPSTTTTTTPSTTTTTPSTTSTTQSTTTTSACVLTGFVDVSNIGCLRIVEESEKWDDANNRCTNFGGELYVATTEADFDNFRQYLVGIPFNQDLWVNAKKRTWDEGGGGLNRQVTGNEWETGQPDDGPNHCVMVKQSSDFYMNDDGCNQYKYFVCQE